MFARMHKFLCRLKRAEPSIAVEADGFSVLAGGECLCRVRWADVREVFAFKEDLGMYDRICLGFRVGGSRDACRVDEEMPGYERLLEEFARLYTEHDRDWWTGVAFPAFATNYTTLWAGPPL